MSRSMPCSTPEPMSSLRSSAPSASTALVSGRSFDLPRLKSPTSSRPLKFCGPAGAMPVRGRRGADAAPGEPYPMMSPVERLARCRGGVPAAEPSGRPMSSVTPTGLVERLHVEKSHPLDALHDQLRDAVAAPDRERLPGVEVDQFDEDLASIALVDRPGGVDDRDAVAGREPGAGVDETGVAGR